MHRRSNFSAMATDDVEAFLGRCPNATRAARARYVHGTHSDTSNEHPWGLLLEHYPKRSTVSTVFCLWKSCLFFLLEQRLHPDFDAQLFPNVRQILTDELVSQSPQLCVSPVFLSLPFFVRFLIRFQCHIFIVQFATEIVQFVTESSSRKCSRSSAARLCAAPVSNIASWF
jgi:hypothetical protein